MRWHVTYTISMGKHGNQRIVVPFEGTEDQLLETISQVGRRTENSMAISGPIRKAFPVKNIMLIEWSESK